MTEPPPHHTPGYETPVVMYLAARQEQSLQPPQNQDYSGNNEIVDGYLRGEVPFEQYWHHLQQQTSENLPFTDYHQPTISYSVDSAQDSYLPQESSAYTTLANIVGEIEISELNASTSSDQLEEEEIDFSVLFPASRDHDTFSYSKSSCPEPRSRAAPTQKTKNRGKTSSGGKRKRREEVASFSSSNSYFDDGSERLMEELLSNETQDLLAEYSQGLTVIGVEDDEDDEVQEIMSQGSTDGYDDDPLDKDYVPGGKEKPSGGKRGRGRPPRSNRGPQKSQRSKKGANRDDEDSVFGVPEEWREMEGVTGKTSRDPVRPLRKLPETLQGLVGQANMYYAQGRKEEALQMMEEVLREKPKNPEAYQCLANLFEDMGDKEKQLQCGLLAAYLDYLTPAGVWANLGQLAEELNKTDQAVACYGKACKADPGDWSNYESKLRLLEGLGDTKRIFETKVAAVKGMKETEDFEWYKKLAKEAAEMAFVRKEEIEAVNCYRHLLEKGKIIGLRLYELLEKQTDTLMQLNHFTAAAKTTFEFSDLEAYDGNGQLAVCFGDNELPFPPLVVSRYRIPEDFTPKLEIKLVVCWLEIDRYDLAQPLLDIFGRSRQLNEDYLEIERVYMSKRRFDLAKSMLERMLKSENLIKSAAVWLAYAEVLLSQGKLDEASEAFEKVVELAPGHVEARVSLAALQQQLGQAERALETLEFGVTPERFDIQNVEVKDERLLHKECLILYSQQKWEGFLRCAYRILAPYFYDIYAVQVKREATRSLYRDKYGLKRISIHVRRVTLETCRDTLLERLVKKIGKALLSSSVAKQKSSKLLTANDINDLCFKVCEVLFEQKRFEELTQVAGFSANVPPLVLGGLSKTFESIMLLGAIQSRNAKVAFSLLHNSVSHIDRPRLWNLYGLTFVLSQDVSYHRIILRAATRQPDNIALTILSGNNSLVSGTYQHALAEYLSVLQQCPSDPLVNLLTGLTCLHLASKKDIARRHDICLQGFAFLSQYEDLRGCCQETHYNLGRAMHQANILFAAIHYYRKVLESEPLVATSDELSDGESPKCRVHDLRPLAAHNLSLIYQNSGNFPLARHLLETYCSV